MAWQRLLACWKQTDDLSLGIVVVFGVLERVIEQRVYQGVLHSTQIEEVSLILCLVCVDMKLPSGGLLYGNADSQ